MPMQMSSGQWPSLIHTAYTRPKSVARTWYRILPQSCPYQLIDNQLEKMNITFPQKLRTASLNSPGQLRHRRDVPAPRHEASGKLSRLPGYFSNMIRLSPLITLDGKIQHPASTYNYHLCTCVYALRRSLTTLMLTYLRPIHH